MTPNKNHWYDGWLYDRLIAPHQDPLFERIKKEIGPQKKVLDIGCGTGRLAFTLGDNCKSVLGLDLSKRNIERAQTKLAQISNKAISFRHERVEDLPDEGNFHFDYAVFTYVIHEVDEAERVGLLRNAAQISDQIIIGDYLVPRPHGMGSLFTWLIELIAGSDHFKNFRNFVKIGGIPYLAERAGLEISHVLIENPGNFQVWVLTKNRFSDN